MNEPVHVMRKKLHVYNYIIAGYVCAWLVAATYNCFGS